MSENSTIKKIKKQANANNSKNIKVINSNKKMWIPFLLMMPVILMYSLFTIIPLIKVGYDAVTIENINHANNFAQIWTDPMWYYAMGDSMIYALISMPIMLVLALVISFAVSNIIRKKFRSFWQSIFFIPYVTSAIAVSIAFNTMFQTDAGLINFFLGTNIGWTTTGITEGNWGMIVVLAFGVWNGLAFKILILTTAMLSIDKRLYDAASIDGATSKELFFNVTVPSLEKTIWYLITMGLIGALKIFPLALFDNNIVTVNSNAPTMMSYVYGKIKSGTPQYGLAGASSLSLIIVVIIFNKLVKKSVKSIQSSIYKYSDNKLNKEILEFEERKIHEKGYNTNIIKGKTKELDKIINNINKAGDK